MRKIVNLLLIVAMMTCLCACGSNEKAYNASKDAYNNITVAYEISEQFGEDIYEAWRMGIYDDDKISVKYLAKELNLTEEELTEGIVNELFSIIPKEGYADLTGEEKEEFEEGIREAFREEPDAYFQMFESDLFSACVRAVTSAYDANGKAGEAQQALEEAKKQMRELSEKYSDYEHYPNLKGYYTTTSSLLDFCQNPTGSFEQIKETINDYRNEARDYASDLDYIFEE